MVIKVNNIENIIFDIIPQSSNSFIIHKRLNHLKAFWITFKYKQSYRFIMEDFTQIQVTKKTKKELQKIRITRRETYEEIIIRLLNE